MISRKEAKELRHIEKERNELFFFTGRPCKYGHICNRYVSFGGCVDCTKTSENHERQKQYSQSKKGKEVNRIASQKYRQSDKRKIVSERWLLNNPEKRKQATRKWQQKNPDKVRANAMKRYTGKLQRLPKWADLSKIQTFYDNAVRLSKETGIMYHVDHIIPLQGEYVSGLHVENNLQVMIGVDNIRKSNKMRVELHGS